MWVRGLSMCLFVCLFFCANPVNDFFFFCPLKVTGKKLLEKGELQRRYTIIPLNKISARTLDDKVVNAAKNLVRLQNTARFRNFSFNFILPDPEQ